MSEPLYYYLGTPWLALHNVFGRFFPPRRGFRILTFHDVPSRSFNAFKRVLDYVLKTHGVLTPAEVSDIVNHRPFFWPPERTPCLITFDDGYASNAEVARTILDERGIRAVFFVCPSIMDVPAVKQNDVIAKLVYEGQRIPPDMRAMTWHDAGNLLMAGHTIGSHTLNHRRLSTLTHQEREEEILRSGHVLETRLGERIRWFAYPFGTIQSIDEDSYSIIRKRYDYCCTGVRGLNTAATSAMGLLRDPIDPAAPFDYQRLSLTGGLDFLYRGAAARIPALTGK